MRPLRLEAPAKLNLGLRVVGRRDDGFHLLEGELVLLELADRLLLLPGGSGLRVEGAAAAGLPLDGTNLALRGLAAGLGDEPAPACLVLDKRIPHGAGLGGGSSDAAAAWRLGRAWRGLDQPPTADEITALVAIGADVPFFAAGVAAARVSGIGERVEALDAPAAHVVLVHPSFALSTAAVFAELRRGDWGGDDNDLLPAARRLRPELDDVFAAVRRAGGRPRLTGSGPTVFSLEADPEAAAGVARAVGDAGFQATLTRTRRGPAAIEAIDPTDQEEESTHARSDQHRRGAGRRRPLQPGHPDR